jgi:transposase
MKAYTLDLRERVVRFVHRGGTRAEAARRFSLGLRSVYRYLAAAKADTLAPKTTWGGWRTLDPGKLAAYVRQHPAATLHELKATFGVSHKAVWVRLRQLGYTLKKLVKYRERNEVQRSLFRRAREQLGPVPVFFLDACGVDHRLHRAHGRAPRSERLYQAVPGRRRGRTSVIAACHDGKLVAPLTFDGTCTPAVVDAYFAQVLLPGRPRGSVIVLDNARFHQSPTTAQLVEAAGCPLLLLPPYSPDLNPIEHLWAAVKARLRKALPAATDHALCIGKTCLCYC